uniref:Uncharacterized protein n=1 Tax=Arundo donax TaxID=35708 RepID=A0A0A8YB09_ARUDO
MLSAIQFGSCLRNCEFLCRHLAHIILMILFI